MCGRFALDKNVNDLIEEFVAVHGIEHLQEWRPSYNIAPTDPVPIVRERMHADELIRQWDLASWGLKPAWAKPGPLAPINARLETVTSNRMFRNAFAARRCLVPMNGYFEWQATETGKQPYFIHGPHDVLAAAGLYESHRTDDGWAVTTTIITREASDASGEIHPRMPVCLTPDNWDAWLAPGKTERTDDLLDMIDRTSAAVARSLTSYPVSRRVNSVRDETVSREDPTLIEPIDL